jgi:hypothetical protein
LCDGIRFKQQVCRDKDGPSVCSTRKDEDLPFAKGSARFEGLDAASQKRPSFDLVPIILGIVFAVIAWLVVRYLSAGLFTVNQNELSAHR